MRLSAVLLACLTAASVPDASAAPSARRIPIARDGQLVVPLAGIVTLVVTDPSRAEITQTATGFRVKALRSGDTIVQAFTADGFHVFVISVGAPTPAPVSTEPAVGDKFVGDFGSLSEPVSRWGINKVGSAIQFRTGFAMVGTHTLELAGKLDDGDYRLSTAWVSTNFDDLESADLRLTWNNRKKTQFYEAGDIAVAFAGGSMLPSLPLFGVKARYLGKPASSEMAVGFLRVNNVRWAFATPAVALAGEHFFGHPEKTAVTLRVAGSAIGFQTPDRSGFMNGAQAQALVHKVLFLEGRASFVGTETIAGDSSQAASAGLVASYTCPTTTYRAEYEGQSDGYYQPISNLDLRTSHRASMALSRQLAEGLSGSAGLAHGRVRGIDGEFARTSSLIVGASAKLDNATTLSVSESETTQSGAVGAGTPLHRRAFVASLGHQFDPMSRLDTRLGYDLNRYADGTTGHAGSATAAVSRVREQRWAAQGSANVSAGSTSVLAEDQRPFNLQASVTAAGTLYRGPIQLQGSMTVQEIIAPTTSTGVSLSLGADLTPTTADRISASLYLWRGTSREDVALGATLGFTHYFGNDVDAKRLMFLPESSISGVVCIDENVDGACGKDEAPLSGVRIQLSKSIQVQSDARGRFAFHDVNPGSYLLEIDETKLRTKGRLTSPSQIPVTIKPGDAVRQSFGVRQGCSLQGRVIDDLDMDGVRGETDSMLAGIGLTVTGEGKTYNVTTDGMGLFDLDVTRCGTYVVAVDPGSLPASVGMAVDEISVTMDPTAAPPVAELIGFKLRAVHGTVFLDANRNGVLDAGETPVVGATVATPRGSVVSDDAGAFLMRRLPAGTLELAVDLASLPAGMVPGAPVSVEFGEDPGIRELQLPVVPAP